MANLRSRVALEAFIRREIPVTQLGQPLAGYLTEIFLTMTQTLAGLGGTGGGGEGRNFIDNPLQTDEIGSAVVTFAKLAASSVGTGQIINGAVTASKVAASAISSGSIVNGAITTEKIRNGAVNNDKLGAGAVGTTNIQSGAVGASQIRGLAIDSSKLAINAVGTANIQNNAVVGSKIAANQINNSHLQNDAVDEDTLANDSVGADHLQVGAVTAPKIDSNAVTSIKVATNAISTAKLQDSAVTSAKIASGAVGVGALGFTNPTPGRVLGINPAGSGLALLEQTTGGGGGTETPTSIFAGLSTDIIEIPVIRSSSGTTLSGATPYAIRFRGANGADLQAESLRVDRVVAIQAGVQTSTDSTLAGTGATINGEVATFSSSTGNITISGGGVSIILGFSRAQGFQITTLSSSSTFDYLQLSLSIVWQGAGATTVKVGFRSFIAPATPITPPVARDFILYTTNSATTPTQAQLTTNDGATFTSLPIRWILNQTRNNIIIARDRPISEVHIAILEAGEGAADIPVSGAFNRYNAANEITVGNYSVLILDISFEVGDLVAGNRIGIGIR